MVFQKVVVSSLCPQQTQSPFLVASGPARCKQELPVALPARRKAPPLAECLVRSFGPQFWIIPSPMPANETGSAAVCLCCDTHTASSSVLWLCRVLPALTLPEEHWPLSAGLCVGVCSPAGWEGCAATGPHWLRWPQLATADAYTENSPLSCLAGWSTPADPGTTSALSIPRAGHILLKQTVIASLPLSLLRSSSLEWPHFKGRAEPKVQGVSDNWQRHPLPSGCCTLFEHPCPYPGNPGGHPGLGHPTAETLYSIFSFPLPTNEPVPAIPEMAPLAGPNASGAPDKLESLWLR